MRFPYLLAALLAAASATAMPARPLVAIIDSGIARTPELRTVLAGEHDMAASPARPPYQPRYDHGTMVATILTREAKGAVDIMSFRIDDPAGCPPKLNPPCQSSAEPVARAIREATRLGVDAINVSLTLQDDQAIVDAVRDAADHGILIVLAAGNEGRDRPANRRMAAAAAAHAVIVGAVDAKGQPWAGSNRPEPAPSVGYEYVWRLGVDVPTKSASGAPVVGTGTSFAAPIETARRLTAAAPIVASVAVAAP